MTAIPAGIRWLVTFEFLGTGTSAGVPALGCECAVCVSPDPRDRRLRTSGLVQWTDADGQDRAVLIDCGPDFRQQALRSGLKRLDAIVFTHNHVDHTFGLDEVRRYNAVQGGAIDVYGEDHTLAFLRRVYEHIFEPSRNINESFVATLRAHAIQPGVAVEVHGMRFTPIRLMHGRLPVIGFRIEPAATHVAISGVDAVSTPSPFPLAYCTDVSSVPPEAWEALTGVNTLVLNALRHRHHPTHLTVEQAVGVASRVRASATYFVHMSHDLAHGETQAALPPAMFLAHDGLVLG